MKPRVLSVSIGSKSSIFRGVVAGFGDRSAFQCRPANLTANQQHFKEPFNDYCCHSNDACRPTPSRWEVLLLRPGGDPITNLARSLIDADLYDADDEESLPRLKATLDRSRLGLVEAIKQSDMPEGSNLLVVVDQFEELFRFRQTDKGHQETAGAFVKLLLAASQ